MKRKIIKDSLLRQLIQKKDLFFVLTKMLFRINSIKYKQLICILYKIQKTNYFSKIRNRCFITGRNNSINKLTKISRLKFKELARAGVILGFSKYSR